MYMSHESGSRSVDAAKNEYSTVVHIQYSQCRHHLFCARSSGESLLRNFHQSVQSLESSSEGKSIGTMLLRTRVLQRLGSLGLLGLSLALPFRSREVTFFDTAHVEFSFDVLFESIRVLVILHKSLLCYGADYILYARLPVFIKGLQTQPEDRTTFDGFQLCLVHTAPQLRCFGEFCKVSQRDQGI
jgi:hypothetical protein